MVRGYQLHPYGKGILQPHGYYGLGKQKGAFLEALEYPGYLILHRRCRRSDFPPRDVTDIQHR